MGKKPSSLKLEAFARRTRIEKIKKSLELGEGQSKPSKESKQEDSIRHLLFLCSLFFLLSASSDQQRLKSLYLSVSAQKEKEKEKEELLVKQNERSKAADGRRWCRFFFGSRCCGGRRSPLRPPAAQARELSCP